MTHPLKALLAGTAAATITAAVLAAAHPTPANASPPSSGRAPRPIGTQVATLTIDASRYARPGKREGGKVPARWFGRPSALPVIASRPGWVRVRLAQRPNGSTTWLRSEDVKLSRTPYRIVIDLSTKHLKLYKGDRGVMSAPAGIGARDDPTPTGSFFVAFRQGPPRPNLGYGPFILVTSAHSGRIANWERSGDAVIGIHGPLGRDRAIGTRGARISHGCIRLHNRSLTRLRAVPPGTPIDVTH
ncbi:L,D-transpeptidase [Actinomadura oligospora]|uniref:L,D-transpeptidase n=1 Tax=Actinomadura oligospora TaxID=111804 RepID=UPI0004B3290D|nr:L,D-transpeptidase [Actinomadura oligospora]